MSLLIGTVEKFHEHFFDEHIYRLLVSNLMKHGYYGYAPGQLIAWRAPGYTFFEAALRSIHNSYSVVRVSQALLAALAIVLGGLLAWRLFGKRVALWTTLLLTVTGTIAAYSAVELTETLATTSLLAGILTLILAWRDRAILVLPAGILFGISAMTRPQILFLIPVLAVLTGFRLRNRRRWLRAMVFLAASAAVLLPWTVRNYLRFHALVPVSTEGGVNLWLANNPSATGRFKEIDTVDPKTYARISQMPDEVARDREWTSLAIDYISEHPIASFRNWLRDGAVYLGARDSWVTQRARLRDKLKLPFLDDRFLLPFVPVGLLMAFRMRKQSGLDVLIPAVVISYLVAFFMVTIPDARFRHELIPFTCLYTAVALDRTARGVRRRLGRQVAHGGRACSCFLGLFLGLKLGRDCHQFG